MSLFSIINRFIDSLKKGLRKLDKRQGYRGPIGHKDIDPKNELEKKESYRKIVLKRGDRVTATVLNVSSSKATVITGGITGELNLKDAKWAKKIIDDNGEVIRKYKNCSIITKSF